MKSALLRIFRAKTPGMSNEIQVNQQDVAFFIKQRPQGRGQRYMLQTGQQRQPLAGTNPLDTFGKRSRCAII